MLNECGASGLVALLSPSRATSPKSPEPAMADELSPAGAAVDVEELTEAQKIALSAKYRNVLAELAETEQVYLKDLSAIIHGYQRQLQDCLTEDELDMIFGNMEELHAFHSDLCAKIKDCVQRCPQMIGKVFVEMGLDRFMVYEQYYLDHTKSLSFLLHKQEDKTFLALLVACQTNLGHQLPLADYLLKPVQRLLKYPLLLSELTKSMPTSSPGYASILAASKLLKDVADSINEIKRQLDVSRYVDGLQQRLLGWNGPNLQVFGQLKDAGDFRVSDASGKKSQRQVLLFESAILICKPRTGGFVSVKHYFNMDVLFLQTMLNEQLCFRLTVADNKKVYFTFFCQTQEDKQYWIAKFKKVIIDFHTKDKSAVAALDGESAKRRGYHFRNRRKKITASQSASLGTIAPVSKKREDDVLLNHNPYAQAGGYDEEPQVKQVVRREESKRLSRKESRRRDLDLTDDGGEAAAEVEDDLPVPLAAGSGLAQTRDSVISTGSEDAGPVFVDSPPPVRRNAQRRRLSSVSMALSSARSSPVTPWPAGMESPTHFNDHHISLSSLQFSSNNSSPARMDFVNRFNVASPALRGSVDFAAAAAGTQRAGVDSGLPEDGGPGTVIRCFFPDGSHTSVSIKPEDTLSMALRVRLMRRGHLPGDCIVRIPGDHQSAVVGWDEPAMEALRGHTTIIITKIRASAPDLPRKGSIIRLPSGHSLDLESAEAGVLTPSPKKGSPLKDTEADPRLSYNSAWEDSIRRSGIVLSPSDDDTDPADVDRVFCTPEPRPPSEMMDPIRRWTQIPETPEVYKTTSFLPPDEEDNYSTTPESGGGDPRTLDEFETLDEVPESPIQSTLDRSPLRTTYTVEKAAVGPAGTVSAPHHSPSPLHSPQLAVARPDEPMASPDMRHGISYGHATLQSALARAAAEKVRQRGAQKLHNELGETTALHDEPAGEEAPLNDTVIAEPEEVLSEHLLDDAGAATAAAAATATVSPEVAASTVHVKRRRRRRRKVPQSNELTVYAPTHGPQPKIPSYKARELPKRIMPHERRLDVQLTASRQAQPEPAPVTIAPEVEPARPPPAEPSARTMKKTKTKAKVKSKNTTERRLSSARSSSSGSDGSATADASRRPSQSRVASRLGSTTSHRSGGNRSSTEGFGNQRRMSNPSSSSSRSNAMSNSTGRKAPKKLSQSAGVAGQQTEA
eukprot:m.90395 g.90395  ORF g.90395 m.90395 type:complete len:1188 (+) comp11842_c0_seq4:230-3793(+)